MNDFSHARFLRLAAEGHSIMLTGQAGTGKTTLLQDFLDECGEDVAVTASTGIAALNLGGMTMHRWSGMMLGPKRGENLNDHLRELMRDERHGVRNGFNRVRNCRVLVLDEVSMLPGVTLEFLDLLCRTLRRDDRPFGGIQVIATGDFLQLPPVRTDPSEPYDWAFQAMAWVKANFQVVHLTKVHRQDEPEFLGALGEFRRGRITGNNARLLASRVTHFPDPNIPRLFTHNSQVDKWNAYRLACIECDESVYEARTQGPDSQIQFLRKNLLTPSTLIVKPGARVMFTVNRPDHGYVNGQTGTVIECGRDAVRVQSQGGVINVERYDWRFDSRDRHSATFTQMPLRLAWSLTIHKAQGLTLDSAYIDVRAAREPGQAYVALSRVRSLAGLNLKAWFNGVFVSRAALEFYAGITPSHSTPEPTMHAT